MHPVSTMKNWSHHLHDDMLSFWHHVDQHLHSSHFWVGVGVTLFFVGLLTLFVLLAWKFPIELEGGYPGGYPYAPFR